MATSIGLQTTARGPVTAATVVGNRALTFGPTPVAVEKIYTIYDAALPVPPLREVSFEEMRLHRVGSGKARAYAVQTITASTVTVLFDNTPAVIFTWTADADVNLATLSGSQVPAFPLSYHNLLIYGAMVVELEKMEKYEMARIIEKKYEDRCSELRLYIAESNYKEIYQGKMAGRVWW